MFNQDFIIVDRVLDVMVGNESDNSESNEGDAVAASASTGDESMEVDGEVKKPQTKEPKEEVCC